MEVPQEASQHEGRKEEDTDKSQGTGYGARVQGHIWLRHVLLPVRVLALTPLSGSWVSLGKMESVGTVTTAMEILGNYLVLSQKGSCQLPA